LPQAQMGLQPRNGLGIGIDIVGFNVPLDTFTGHFGDDFTGQTTQPTV